MEKKLNVAQKVMLAIIFFLATFAAFVVISSEIRNNIIRLAGTVFFGELVKDASYCNTMLIINAFKFELLLVYAAIATIFFDKYKYFFLYDYKTFFSICIIAFFVTSNLAIIASRFFVGYGSVWDFGDFLQLEYYAKAPLNGTNYPPLAVVLHKILYLLVPSVPGVEKSFAINYLLNLYILGTALSLFILFFSSIDGTNRQKIFYSCVMFMTGPILFAYERMNIIFISLIGTLVFVLFYPSKNKWLKEFALISLAVAANIKLFPAVFGALLLKEKKWKEAVRAALYGIAMFVIPIFISNFLPQQKIASIEASPVQAKIIQANYNNDSVEITTPHVSIVDNAKTFFENSKSFTENPKVMTSISIKAITYRLLSNFSIKNKVAKVILILSVIISFVSSLFCFFIAQRQYQSMLMLSFLCIFIPTSSAWYGLTFLVIPLLFYFSDSTKTKIDGIVSIFFILIFVYCFGYFKFLQPQSCWHIVCLWLITMCDIMYTRFFKKENKNK